MEPAEVDDEEEDEGEITVHLIHCSLNRHAQTMYVNLYEDHFSYIHNLKKLLSVVPVLSVWKVLEDGLPTQLSRTDV